MTFGPVCSLRDTVAFLQDAAVFSAERGLDYGDLYRVRVPGYDVQVVTDPSAIEQIVVRSADHFEKSRVYWRELRRIVGDALGSLEGERWQYLHEVQQPFFTPRAAQRYLPVAHQLTTAHLAELARSVGAGRDVPVLRLLSELNLRILLTVLFDAPEGASTDGFWDRITDGEATIAWRSKFPWRPATAWLTGANQRSERHKAFFGAYADQLRQRSPQDPERESLLDAIVRIGQDPAAPRFPDTLLRNEIIVHLGAGTETQGTAEGWILHLLWQNPGQLSRLRAEVDAVAGAATVAPEHLERLVFARQVVREGLRLYPPSYALVRDCIRPTAVNGRSVPVGQVQFISLYALHRNPRLWDDPERFDPDRFAAGRAETIGRFQYLPFGAGKHVCIGQHLALPGMILAIAQFAQRFDWHFLDPHVRPIGLSTLKPSGAFTARLTPRQ